MCDSDGSPCLPPAFPQNAIIESFNGRLCLNEHWFAASRRCCDHLLPAKPRRGPAPVSTKADMMGRTCRLVSEQLGRELRKVVSPVDPRMSARRLDEHRREPVTLQEIDRRDRRRQQEVLLAGAEPQQTQTTFQSRVGELRRVLL